MSYRDKRIEEERKLMKDREIQRGLMRKFQADIFYRTKNEFRIREKRKKK